jgi:large subunit ribosomal protein L4
MTLSEKFTPEVSDSTIYESVVNYLANQRQGTHATKTKGLVSGGGKKPWRQKHTGRARAGSIRSPLWRGGGIIFGPQPRDYSYSMPKSAKRVAFFKALSRKIKDGEAIVLDSLTLSAPKTKEMASLLKGLGLDGKSVLVMTAQYDNTIRLASRNIPTLSVVSAKDVNTYELLTHDIVLTTKEALTLLEEMR